LVSTQTVDYPLVMRWVNRAIELGRRRGLNQTDLARIVGKNRGYLGKIAKGEARAVLNDVMRIAEELGVSMDYLLTEDMPWLDPSERQGVAPELDRGSDAILRVVSAYRLSTEEAIRRLASPSEAGSVVGVRGPFPLSRDQVDGKPSDADLDDSPSGEGRGVDRRR